MAAVSSRPVLIAFHFRNWNVPFANDDSFAFFYLLQVFGRSEMSRRQCPSGSYCDYRSTRSEPEPILPAHHCFFDIGSFTRQKGSRHNDTSCSVTSTNVFNTDTEFFIWKINPWFHRNDLASFQWTTGVRVMDVQADVVTKAVNKILPKLFALRVFAV